MDHGTFPMMTSASSILIVRRTDNKARDPIKSLYMEGARYGNTQIALRRPMPRSVCAVWAGGKLVFKIVLECQKTRNEDRV